MKMLIFGASGMVGQGVLRECLLDDAVTEVKVIGRTRIPIEHIKLKQIVTNDLLHLEAFSSELTGYDGCFFSLGVSVIGLNEEQYRKINYDIPMSIANVLVKTNPNLVFMYVSGRHTDSTEKGPIMWARNKGKTENDLMKLPFKGAYMIRLAGLVGKNGEVPKAWYRHVYAVAKPIMPMLEKAFPDYVINTETFGRAMVNIAKRGHEKTVVESGEFRKWAGV